MLDFETRLQGIGQQTILCVGDLMLECLARADLADGPAEAALEALV